MKEGKEHNIDDILLKAKRNVLPADPDAAFDNILNILVQPESSRTVSFRLLSNAGAVLLLLILVNIILLNASTSRQAVRSPQGEAGAVYLQSYNLNIY